ncbi:MAG: FAD-dependent thymidylate synthase, partial [Clostridiales bacterium]|nr:FAD-dependent thymidylate synthase [Clostridiales bacterium]
KLAQENARYVLSVFLPATTMSYTTSIRQINYIMDWCEKYVQNAPESNEYEKRLKDEIKLLGESLKSTSLVVSELNDTKSRRFEFLARQTDYKIYNANESFSDSYLIKYDCSLAMLGQAQRHRTIDYFMNFDGNPKSFYVPKCIVGTSLEKEWLTDLESVKNNTPNATMVQVVETGLFSKFLLKCDERLCGRAQLEIMDNCIEVLKEFAEKDQLSDFMKEEMKSHYHDGKIRMKCHNIKCGEPCFWGPLKSQTKLV